MRNKVVILISIIIIIFGVIAMILGFGGKSISGNVYISDSVSNNDVLENVVLIHAIDYDYLGEVDTIEHDWLIHNEPDYMLDVIEACAVVVDSYFDGDVPTIYHYSESYEYTYLTSESSVCLLIPEDSSMNELIVEVSREKVYLYEIR